MQGDAWILAPFRNPKEATGPTAKESLFCLHVLTLYCLQFGAWVLRQDLYCPAQAVKL